MAGSFQDGFVEAGSDEETAPGDGAVEAVTDPAAAERRVLIDLLIYAWDRAKSPGVWERLSAGLESVGVQVIRPDGEKFDPAHHEAGGIERTDDPARHDVVAETELAGFVDRGTVIREPVVVVYRLADPVP
ncbi:nucleotide exchange factor GrpE [Nakamurella sp. YIM 132087]|uniref:Nucleotide exchange factor GrpE n=1 Tax=Nakamurella alba TaxID=2665158 RepID=A0A7K1FP57_9ACTN|nr:nucleotide exchange factor GrpE [Nakamurella alba]